MVDIDIKVSLHCLNPWKHASSYVRSKHWLCLLVVSFHLFPGQKSGWSPVALRSECPGCTLWANLRSLAVLCCSPCLFVGICWGSVGSSPLQAHLFESSHWSPMLVTRSYTTSWYVVHHSNVNWLHLKLGGFLTGNPPNMFDVRSLEVGERF